MNVYVSQYQQFSLNSINQLLLAMVKFFKSSNYVKLD
jgi:hypothetical protein